MVNYKSLSIVPLDSIPKDIVECPTDDLVDLYKLCSYMAELCTNEKGIGLSAVQVGVPWKVFVVKYMCMPDGKDYFRYFVNCTYAPVVIPLALDEKEKSLEGCLSLKKSNGELRYFEVERYKNIVLKGQELKSEPNLELVDVHEEPKDYYRIVYQHEVDHQQLVLISDIGKEIEIWKN